VTNLYRCFDGDGRLLYVGISWSTKRFNQHLNGKRWWREVRTITIDHHRSRSRAARAEVEAIKAEDPLYNRAHRRGELRDPISDPKPGDWRVEAAHATEGGWHVALTTPDGVEVEWDGLQGETMGEAVDLALYRSALHRSGGAR
jgi:hypothetical protein